MKLSYEELIAEQKRWYPIILVLIRNKVPKASKKVSLILSAIVQWAGWGSEEIYQETMRRRMERVAAKGKRPIDGKAYAFGENPQG